MITKEGHNVLDVIFTSPIQSLGRHCDHICRMACIDDFKILSCLTLAMFIAAEVAESLDKVDGVVDHGIISKSQLVSTSLLYLAYISFFANNSVS